MSSIRKKSIKTLAEGLFKFEDSRNAVKNADFSDLKTFIRDYLNTSEPKQRKKLAEEFKKRHTELISAETEITKIIQAALSGEAPEAENKQLTNLLEMIGESANDIQ